MNPSAYQQSLEAAFDGVHFTDELRRDFFSCWSAFEFPRTHLITEAERTERYLYFVVEGVQALYLIDQKGEKIVLGFTFQNELSGVYDSFLLQQPAQFFLEALTPSRLLGLPFKDHQRLFDQYPSFNIWGRRFAERVLIGRTKREVELLTLTAEERYIRFMRRCPPELLQIPQKYLAAYLNMTPETFSRLRRKVRY